MKGDLLDMNEARRTLREKLSPTHALTLCCAEIAINAVAHTEWLNIVTRDPVGWRQLAEEIWEFVQDKS